jgi:WD40 repeat protein
MYLRNDGAFARCKEPRLAPIGRSKAPLLHFRRSTLIAFSIKILASASYDASVYLFADDPDSDWSPFQKLNPSLAVTATATTTDDMQVEPDEDDFEIPALVEPETVWAVAFSPCGGYLASGGDLGGVRIWTRK